jgi:hypothetical protein
MSSISGLGASDVYCLLSSPEGSSTASTSTNSQAGTATQATSSSLNEVPDAANLACLEESTSLVQLLDTSNPSQDLVSCLESSALLNVISRTNLFKSNPQFAESLLGLNFPSTSTETATTSSGSSSQTATSSDISSNLPATAGATDLSQTNPDLTQALLQDALPDSTDVTSTQNPGSILNLIA